MSGPGPGPVRVIEIVLDDARFDDGSAVMNAGPRSGQRVLEDLLTRVRDKAVDFQMMRNDISYCAPARAAMQTGNNFINHGVTDTNIGTYYQYIRRGTREAKTYDAGTQRYKGPYEFDLALKLGAQILAGNPSDATGLALMAQTSVAPSDQGSVVGFLAGSSNTVRDGWDATNGYYSGTIGRGDTNDDLQAFTGCRVTWLSQAGVDKIGIFGKNQNGSGTYTSGAIPPFTTADSTGSISHARTTRFIPPGVTDYCCDIIDDQNHDDMPVCEGYGLTNPGSGDGAIGVNYEYIYTYPITAISYSAGVVTVTATNPNTNTTGLDTLIHAGEEIGIDFANNTTGGIFGTGFNVNYVNVASIVSQTSSTVTLTFSSPSISGTVDITNAVLCPHKMFSEQVIASKIISTLDTYDNDDSFFVQWGSRMPHGSLGGNAVQASKRYELTVAGGGYINPAIDYTRFGYWNGYQGNYAPAVVDGNGSYNTVTKTSELTTTHRKNWGQRQHMLAGANDAIKRVLDYCDSRWSTDGYIIIITTDNGYQLGEQDQGYPGTEGDKRTPDAGLTGELAALTWSPIGGKIFVYEGSTRLFCWMRHPDYEPQVTLVPVFVGDFCLTILDLFAHKYPGLTNHHAHTNRDGKSLLRMLNNPADPDQQRLLWGAGLYCNTDPTPGHTQQQDGQWVYRHADYLKLCRKNSAPSVRQLFNMTPGVDWVHGTASPVSASTDWETVNHDDGFGGNADALSTALDSLKVAGWDVGTQTNTMKSIRA